MKIKAFIRYILGVTVLSCLTLNADAQIIKINGPLILTGSPNLGFEYTLSRQFTLNAEALWMPYMFKSGEEVFRILQGSIDLRYYFNPQNFYTNDSWDGFYAGPYAMYGDYNVGLIKNDDKVNSIRRVGWGVSGGISAGYKYALNSRWALDFNIGIGYAYLQYDKYQLGGEYVNFPLERKRTRHWVGPTKFGVHLSYNIFR